MLRAFRKRNYSTLGSPLTIGIRREAKNRWERRVPLVPDHVERLVKEIGCVVLVQPSKKRVIPNEKYEEVGAIISEDLNKADVILGVKEVPLQDLIPMKTYMFFSHTHKGQTYNMPLLKTIMDKKIRLLDYELLTEPNGKRLVQFSRFAGYGGMVDGLHSLGHRLLAMGYGNPFLAIGMSFMYRCVADARLDVTRTGMVLMDEGLPRELGPIVFVITGNGNVSKGALHVMKCLPHETVKAEDLEKIVKSKDFDNRKIYFCQVTAKDYIVDNDGKFDEEEYYAFPERYQSVFHEKIAPYATFILNGIFWTKKYPRLLTVEQTEKLAKENRLRLLTLADVSCDINGSFEFMGKSSTIDHPFYMYDPIERKEHEDLEGRGIQIMSIDNLPTEMPLEASEFFSEALYPVVAKMANIKFAEPVLDRATITDDDGNLKTKHKWLGEIIQREVGSEIIVSSPKKILLLGSGFVAKPLVDYLLRNPLYSVTIASNSEAEALLLSGNRKRTLTVLFDVGNVAQLGELVSRHDIVVSFVPASMHPIVAQECLNHKKDMVTASYISPAMQKLSQRAKDSGLIFMNEIGLDPGIDHLTACQVFDEVRERNGKISSFVSWCGGLPAPEISNNPFGYKFSWSPKGVLLAGLNSAKFKRHGKFVEIDGKDLFASAVDVPIFKGFSFEGLPNRDSLSYIDSYKLDQEHLETMFRGTLRYKGFSELMFLLSRMGLFRTDSFPELERGIAWGKIIEKLVGRDIKAGLAAKGVLPNAIQYQRLLETLSWLELDSNTNVASPAPSILDSLCVLLQQKLKYEPDERDMVAMHHEFGIKWADGSKEKRTSTMIVYGGSCSYSAMAKTVGLPAAMAVDMILKRQVHDFGVVAPLQKSVYEPILKKLHKENIKFSETIHSNKEYI